MNKLKELRLIVKMNERLGVETEQSVLDQIIAEEQKEQKQIELREERKNVFKSTFADLSGQISKLMAEEKQKSAEEQALLDRFANVLAKIDEIKDSTVSAEPQVTISEDRAESQQVEDILEGVVEIPEPEVVEEAAILAPIEEPSLAKEAAKKIKKKDQPPSMFVQPEPEVTSRDLKDIQRKLQLMEGWVSKISMSGPGGGAVWLRDLDDVARSSVLGATDGQVLTYNESIKKWTAQDPASGSNGSGYTLPTASTTVKGGIKIDGTTITINNQVISANIPAQVQSDWSQSNSSAVDYIKNKPTIPDITPFEDVLAVTGEPMGHEDKAQSVISFDAATRTFTIAPVGAYFEVWVKGTKHTFTTAQSVTLPNTTAEYYVYFDDAGLGAQTTFFVWDQQAPTALIYFNAATGLAPYFADERHGTTLDWQTHEYLHRTRGAVIASGFSIGNYTVGGAVQADISNGTFFDEDLQIDIVHSNTPALDTWQQDLQGPAQIPMFYLSGTGWVRDNPTGYLNKQGTSRPRYNLLSGGTWSVADIDNNKYGATFIVATNNLTYPIIGIMSQSSHASQGDAEALEFSDLILTGFPVAEFRLLYKIVFKAASTHGTLTSVWDLRQLSATTPSSAIGSDHGLLSGLSDNDHPQYQLIANLASDVATLTANNALYLGGVAANQYAYANAVPSIAGLQTTAGLSANVATLSSNNSLYLGGVAANQYAYANGSNFSINNPIAVTYTGATATGYALTIAASNTQGGTGYADFLRVTNKSAGATANSKSFRLTNGGGIEIVNSGYTATILGLSDTGDFSVAGKIQVSGKTAVNGPAFSAYAAAILQTIPSDTQTKVLFQTEEFDTANCYANSRFTPNVEGYYQLNAEVRLDGTSGTGEMMIILYKNGSEYKRGTNQSGTQIAANFWAMQVSSMVYANGSTDYFEIYVQQGSGANRTVTAVNNPAITWFNGCMMRGA